MTSLFNGSGAGQLAVSRTELADTSSAAKGAGLVGYSSALNYAAGTVGYALSHLSNVYIDPRNPTFAGGATTASADCSAQFQAAFDYAVTVNGVVMLPPGVYNVHQIRIRNGVRGFIGCGGTIKFTNAINSTILLSGQKDGESDDVNNCTIQNLRIDCNNNSNPTVGIWAQNVYDCRILDNVIINVAYGWGILAMHYTVTTPQGGGNKIQRNKVFGTPQGPSGLQDWFGIGCQSEAVYSTTPPDPSTPPSTDMWRKTFTAPTAQQYSSGMIITDNYVVGGYYGLSLQGLTDSIVANNHLLWNGRGISLQNRALRNTVTGNYIQENFSAGIHLAFGSCDNNISGNTVNTFIGIGEALIQAYIGCDGNTISNNKLNSGEPTTGQQHGVYIACQSSRNTVSGNTITGRFRLAAIAVSSAWDASGVGTYRYAAGSDGRNTDWMANAASSDNAIVGNTIRRVTTAPAILLDQGKTHAGGATYVCTAGYTVIWDAAYTGGFNAPLVGTIVDGNTDVYTTGGLANSLYLYEDTNGSLNSVKLTNSKFNLPDSNLSINATSPGGYPLASTYFTLPRGRAHFTLVEGNEYFNNSRRISLAEQTGHTSTINMNLAGAEIAFLSAAAGEAISVIATDDSTSCRGAALGQRFRLRMDVNTDLFHNATNFHFQLASAANIKAVGNSTTLGGFNPATAYTAGQVVTYVDMYYCLVNCTGIYPGNPIHWRKCADANCWLEMEIRGTGTALEICRTTGY